MNVQFTSKQKLFTNEHGQSIEYTERCIVFDGISYKVPKTAAQVFDLQFKELINSDKSLELS